MCHVYCGRLVEIYIAIALYESIAKNPSSEEQRRVSQALAIEVTAHVIWWKAVMYD